MKNPTKIILLLITMFAFVGTASGRQRNNNERISREQLAEKQARHIAEKLAFSPEISEKFVTTYINSQKEIWEAGPKKGKTRKNAMSETQTDSMIQARFAHSQKLLDIRKKYYNEYSKFLTAKQIQRVYDLERQMMKRLNTRRSNKHTPAGKQKS